MWIFFQIILIDRSQEAADMEGWCALGNRLFVASISDGASSDVVAEYIKTQ
jgi:hypothetical protein